MRLATRRSSGVLSALALLLIACDPQRDLVAVRRVNVCTDAHPCGPSMDSGQQPSCLETGDCPKPDACADANACKPPGDACAEPGACPSPTLCRGRLCNAVQDRASLCANTTSQLLAVGDGCSSQQSDPSFQFALCSLGGLRASANSPLQLDGDVAVDSGSVNLSASVTIAGTLHYVSPEPMLGDNSVRSERGEPNCGVDPGSAFDIDASITAAASANDNASVGDALARVANFSGDMTLTLGCGRYYARGIEGGGKLTLRVTGNVLLFVEGKIQLERGLELEASPDARLALIVGGSLNVTGDLLLGEADANRHLLIVGNSKVANAQLHLSPGGAQPGTNLIGGSVYAPYAQLVLDYHAPLQVNGALFVRDINLDASLHVRYALGGTPAAGSCGVR